MKAPKVGAVIVGVGLVTASALAIAAENLGKQEYDNNCAVCHGTSGKGNGPYAGIINAHIPDLTTLQKQNKGVFPFNHVYEVIDGRAAVKAHGPRDMPIWGNEYNEKAAKYYGDFYRPYDAEGFVRGRVLALINYIYSLQAK